MKSIVSQLHIILGSISSMLVAFLALVNGTSPTTCAMKATAAFLVFAGFGLIVRYALTDTLAENADSAPGAYARQSGGEGANLDVIIPGTSVAELLANPAEGSRERAAEPGVAGD